MTCSTSPRTITAEGTSIWPLPRRMLASPFSSQTTPAPQKTMFE